MKHSIVEVIDDKKQQETEARIRGMRADFLGMPSLRHGMSIGVLGARPNQYLHRNDCESCGFGIEYISYSKVMDTTQVPICDCKEK